MSDMLEKLLSVEKQAAALLADAEAEANRRTAHARAEIQAKHAELLKTRAVETDKIVEAEREAIAAERAKKNAEYRAGLERKTADTASFDRAATAFLEKGSP